MRAKRPIRPLVSISLLSCLVLGQVGCGLQQNERKQRITRELAKPELAVDLRAELGSTEQSLPVPDVLNSDVGDRMSDELKEDIQAIENWQDLVISMPVDGQQPSDETFAASESGSENSDQGVVIFLPEEDESEVETLEGYNEKGEKVLLDAKVPPTTSVLTIGYREDDLSTRSRVETVGQNLAETLLDTPAANELGFVGAQKLDQITLQNVHEPWYKGAAEVYMVISYLDKDGKGATSLIELPTVDKAKKTYQVNKVFHSWNRNRFQIVDIAFFEHDSNYNYRDLGQVFLKAATSVTTMLLDPSGTALTVVELVSQLSGRVIDALPDSVWTDDDDFIDSINTVEKFQASKVYGSSKGDVEAHISFYELLYNDE